MINAGVEILGFDGGQAFNSTSSLWEGIKVTVHYPDDQDSVSNPISTGDFLIEPTGVLWSVEAVTNQPADASTTAFTLSIKRHFETTTGDNGPALGQVSRGAITTPDKGFVTPHWSSVLVALGVSRYAATVSTQLNNRDNTSDAEKPVSTSQQNALDAKLDIADVVDDLTTTMANKALSANQGSVLKGHLDNINSLLNSDTPALDTLQEIVNYVQLNRADLDALNIGAIAGLQTALDGKVNTSDVINVLTSTETTKPLSAAQGKTLKDSIDAIDTSAPAGTDLSISGTGDTVVVASSTGTDATIPVATGTVAGLMATSDKTKLDSITTNGGDISVVVDLSHTLDASSVTIESSAGQNTVVPAATTTLSGVMSATDKQALDNFTTSIPASVAKTYTLFWG